MERSDILSDVNLVLFSIKISFLHLFCFTRVSFGFWRIWANCCWLGFGSQLERQQILSVQRFSSSFVPDFAASPSALSPFCFLGQFSGSWICPQPQDPVLIFVWVLETESVGISLYVIFTAAVFILSPRWFYLWECILCNLSYTYYSYELIKFIKNSKKITHVFSSVYKIWRLNSL
jgi:hypothetical protein